jgi:hypothetical protein
MQIVGGAIGATAGFFIGGPAGAQIGWLAGSWVGGMLSKSTTPGPKPQSMPNINQALRGSPVYVTFGTNRVYPSTTWRKNWHPTRMKGGGKKGGAKGGGSGGGGAAKGGGSAGVAYTYSQDMIYEFGIMDVPAWPRKGWIGGDAIDQATMTAILAGWPAAQGQIDNVFGLIGTTNDQPKAKLDFTECNYNPGYGTGDPLLETWAYFEQQEGVACAWPDVAWLGFKTLQLGQANTVPQMSLELGPLSTSTSTNFGFINYQLATDVNVQGPLANGHCYVIANSKHWICDDTMTTGNCFGLRAIEDNTTVLLSNATFNVDSRLVRRGARGSRSAFLARRTSTS